MFAGAVAGAVVGAGIRAGRRAGAGDSAGRFARVLVSGVLGVMLVLMLILILDVGIESTGRFARLHIVTPTWDIFIFIYFFGPRSLACLSFG